MIRANELRIGNYVWIDLNLPSLDTHKIQAKDILDIYNGVTVEPIPLTEEWLLKFGSKELKAKRGVLKEYVLKTVRLELSNSHNFYYKNSKVIITSVHQLQNLYFALTQEELTCL